MQPPTPRIAPQHSFLIPHSEGLIFPGLLTFATIHPLERHQHPESDEARLNRLRDRKAGVRPPEGDLKRPSPRASETAPLLLLHWNHHPRPGGAQDSSATTGTAIRHSFRPLHRLFPVSSLFALLFRAVAHPGGPIRTFRPFFPRFFPKPPFFTFSARCTSRAFFHHFSAFFRSRFFLKTLCT